MPAQRMLIGSPAGEPAVRPGGAVRAGAIIAGTVVQGKTGTPVAGALVLLLSGSARTVTDGRGRFAFAAPDSGLVTLRVRHVGFETFERSFRFPDSTPDPLVLTLTEALYPLDPVVATVTRREADAASVSFPVEVVDAHDLRMQAAANAGELLELVPGVTVRPYGALGDVSTVSIRGSTAGQVLVLLDGQRLNSAQTGEVDLSVLPLQRIERIEVVRGGASAQYGADAVGGVVNIITARPEGEGIQGSVRGVVGSFGTRSLHAGGGWGSASGSIFLSYRYLASDGTFPYLTQGGTEETRRNADVRSHALSAAGFLPINAAGGKLGLSGRYYDQQAGDPGMLGFPLTQARKRNRNLLTSTTLEQPLRNHLLRLQLFLHRVYFAYADPLALPPTDSESWNNAWGMELQDATDLADWLHLDGGYALRQDRLTGSALQQEHLRSSHGVYLQAEIGPPAPAGEAAIGFSARPAIRWDSFSDVGGRFSPKLGVVVSAGTGLQVVLKSNIGLSFRAPTFNDLYWPRDNFSIGNPALRPEQATDVDVGLHLKILHGPGFRGGVTWFQNDIRDLILWQPGFGGIWRPDNVGRALLRGVETEVWTGPLAGAVLLGWTYTWLDARDRSGKVNEDGMQLPYRPEHSHRLIARLETGPLRLNAELQYLSRRFTTASNTTYLPAFHTMDITAGWTWQAGPGKVEALLTLRNAENIRYEMADGYPLPGRELRLTLGIDFHSLSSLSQDLNPL